MASQQKIKLLILTPTLQCGGSEKFVATLCNNINIEKFTVCLVVVNNAGAFYNIVNPAIKLIDLKKKRVLFSFWDIKKATRSFAPDIIFSTANHLNLYLAILRKRICTDVKFIAREANIVSINSREAKMPLLYAWLIKRYYHRFDSIICQSEAMRQDLLSNYKINPGKMVVIHNAVQEELVNSQKPDEGDKSAGFKFLTVARLCSQKGIERLVHAVGLISEPFQFFIIGDGAKRNELQKLINELKLQNNVFLLGEKSRPFADMEDADLFLLGSYYEGFPNVLLEAGLLGIPVIAFNAPGGIAEIITDNENGILVPDNDIIAFAAAIKKGITSNFKRQKIIESTKKRFSVSRIIPTIEKLFLKHTEDN